MTRKLLPLICLVLLAPSVWAQQAPPPEPAPQAQPAPSGAVTRPEDVLGQDRLITLQEAVALGLEYNLGLQIIRNDPAFAREEERAAWGGWEPNLIANYERAHNETPITSSLQAFLGTTGNRTIDNFENADVGIAGVLPWGLSYASTYSNDRVSSNSGLYAFKPQYLALWSTQVTVPLLRDLFWGPVDLQVKRSEIGREISDATFQTQLTDGVFVVESTYWTLAAARALERATQQAVDTAGDTLEQTKVRYQVGTASRIEVTQAEANLAQREAEHITALNAVARSQDNLLTVILAPNIGDYANTTVRTEDPTFVDYPVNAEEALEKARARRPELFAAQKNVEDADVLERYAWNQKLPALDVIASYSNNGVSGNQKTPADPTVFKFRDDPNTPVFDGLPFPGAPDLGFSDKRYGANEDFFDGNGFHGYGARLAFSYPIGNDTADARYVQSKIGLRRANTNLRRVEQDVVVNVRSAVRDLQSSIDRVRAAERARIASAEALRAEEEKLRLGESTPHDVQTFQENLLRAQGTEIDALQNYRIAISALERAQGTLLEARGISVDDERVRGLEEY